MHARIILDMKLWKKSQDLGSKVSVGAKFISATVHPFTFSRFYMKVPTLGLVMTITMFVEIKTMPCFFFI